MSPRRDLPDFETILKDTQRHIRAYIAGMGVASHEVDDLAQDVYLEFYKNIHKIPEDAPVIAWLKGIAKNLCLSHFRKGARRSRLHREALAELLAAVEAKSQPAVENGDMFVALDSCYRRLPDKSRELLKLRYQQDLTSASIADAVESTAEAVRISLYRIRNLLKDCINGRLAQQQ